MTLPEFPKVKLDDLEKRPVIVIWALLIAAAIFFLVKWESGSNQCCNDRRYWQDKYIEITTQLLIKNDIIEQQQKIIEKSDADSLLRDKTEESLKKLLNKLK